MEKLTLAIDVSVACKCDGLRDLEGISLVRAVSVPEDLHRRWISDVKIETRGYADKLTGVTRVASVLASRMVKETEIK